MKLEGFIFKMTTFMTAWGLIRLRKLKMGYSAEKGDNCRSKSLSRLEGCPSGGVNCRNNNSLCTVIE